MDEEAWDGVEIFGHVLRLDWSRRLTGGADKTIRSWEEIVSICHGAAISHWNNVEYEVYSELREIAYRHWADEINHEGLNPFRRS